MKTISYEKLPEKTQHELLKNEAQRQLALAINFKIDGFVGYYDLACDGYPSNVIPYVLYATNVNFKKIIDNQAKTSLLKKEYLPLPNDVDFEILYTNNEELLR